MEADLSNMPKLLMEQTELNKKLHRDMSRLKASHSKSKIQTQEQLTDENCEANGQTSKYQVASMKEKLRQALHTNYMKEEEFKWLDEEMQKLKEDNNKAME